MGDEVVELFGTSINVDRSWKMGKRWYRVWIIGLCGLSPSHKPNNPIIYKPSTEVITMKKVLGLLMVMGLMVGCGKDVEVVKEIQPLTGKLIEEYEVYREKSNKPVKHGYYKRYYK